MRFAISLLVKASGPTTANDFLFRFVQSHEAVGVDVARDDILQNFLNKEDITMNGNVPWHGLCEKAREFMQMLVEACSSPRDVIVDCTAATGKNLIYGFWHSDFQCQ